MFQRLAHLCKKSAGVDIVSKMPVNLQASNILEIESRVQKDPEDSVAEIQWPGPGPVFQ